MLSTIRKIKLIGKKKFIIAALNSDYKAFIIYIATLNISFHRGDKIYLSKKAQIAYLKANEASIKVSSKYVNFAEVFSLKLAAKLFKYISINNYTTE